MKKLSIRWIYIFCCGAPTFRVGDSNLFKNRGDANRLTGHSMRGYSDTRLWEFAVSTFRRDHPKAVVFLPIPNEKRWLLMEIVWNYSWPLSPTSGKWLPKFKFSSSSNQEAIGNSSPRQCSGLVTEEKKERNRKKDRKKGNE